MTRSWPMKKIGYEVLTRYGGKACVEVAKYTVVHIGKDTQGGRYGRDTFTITDRQIIWSTDPSRIECEAKKMFSQTYNVFFNNAEIKERVNEAIKNVTSDLIKRNTSIQARYCQILTNKPRDEVFETLFSNENCFCDIKNLAAFGCKCGGKLN